MAASLGLASRLAGFGITEADFAQISADALDDEVLVNTPRMLMTADVTAILGAANS